MDTQPASAASLNDRADFQATSDPAVSAAAETGAFRLLSYRELYELWERQQWATQDLDFTQDRIDWHERIPEEEDGLTGWGPRFYAHYKAMIVSGSYQKAPTKSVARGAAAGGNSFCPARSSLSFSIVK